MCVVLPKFKALTSLRLDAQFMAGELFMQEYQKFYEEAATELQATCPRISCSLCEYSLIIHLLPKLIKRWNGAFF